MPRSVGWGFGDLRKSSEFEFLRPNRKVEIQTWARPDKFVRYRRRMLVGLRADDVKAVRIERLCLSLSLSSCRKTFNWRDKKVSYLNQFRVFRFLYMFMNIMNILCLCYIYFLSFYNNINILCTYEYIIEESKKRNIKSLFSHTQQLFPVPAVTK